MPREGQDGPERPPSLASPARIDLWCARLTRWRERLRTRTPLVVEGKLTRMVGLTLEAIGCQAAIGGRCLIQGSDRKSIEAEVVGFAGEKLFLMPTGDMRGLMPNARVIPTGRVCEAIVGEGLLGRVLDGAGKPIDSQGGLRASQRVPLTGRAINPMARRPIREPLDVGVRAINALLTVGRGQRLGLFAGSGVGKSVLLGMMTRYTSADITVVGLIGERGREVKEFIENILGREGHAPRRGGGLAVRRPTADAAARRDAGHLDRRIFPRPGQAGAAAHGLAHALRPGAARDRASPSASRPPPRVIRRRCSPRSRSWSSAPAAAT